MRVEIPNQITVTIGGLISRGVKAVEVTDAGRLVFTLTDGSTVDLGSVIGPEGPKGETGPEGPAGPAGVKGDTGAAGASIMSIEKSSQSGTTSTYTITMSDGQTFDFEVQSDKGEKGDKGDTGATGPKGPQGEQGPAGIVVQETEPTGPEHPVWVNPKGGASDPSISGKDGTTFTPSVSASGDLSWTNDGGKENPETVNIKGPQGSPGITPNIQIGTVTTLPAGSDATASMGGTAENPVLDLGIPKGEAGGSDLSLGITGAQVGQIAKITAVDASGKPTAWEPVDMASGGSETWEKLVDTSLAESVESVTYTFDNCKRTKALIAPAIASDEFYSGWTRITINNVSYPLFNSRIDNTKGIYIEIDSVYPPYVQASIGTNSKTTTYGFIGGIQTTALENIAPNGVIELGCQTAALLKAGTKIEIWGVKS